MAYVPNREYYATHTESAAAYIQVLIFREYSLVEINTLTAHFWVTTHGT